MIDTLDDAAAMATITRSGKFHDKLFILNYMNSSELNLCPYRAIRIES